MTGKEEKWEIINSFPNYMISTYGRIKSIKTNKLLKPYISKRGYAYIGLTKDKKAYNCQIHRLVAQTFIENPLNKPCVNHIDYNKINNNVDNLEWVTHTENCLWSSKNISLASKDRPKSEEHKKSIRRSLLKIKGNNYIYKTKTGYLFRFRTSKKEDINKTFKTIEEAIDYRNEYFKENEEYVIR